MDRAPTSGGQYHWVSEFASPRQQRYLSFITGELPCQGYCRHKDTQYVNPCEPRMDGRACMAGRLCVWIIPDRNHHPRTDQRAEPGVHPRTLAGYPVCVCHGCGNLHLQRLRCVVDAPNPERSSDTSHCLLGDRRGCLMGHGSSSVGSRSLSRIQ